MADSLTSLTSTPDSSSQNAADLLVESFKRTQQSKIDTLTQKQNTLQFKQNFFTALKSRLDALISNIDSFTSANASTKFVTRSITSSNNSVVTASAKGEAAIGINTIKVNRLASNDILIAKRLNIGSSDTFSVSGEDLTFKINDKEIKITIASGTTNEQAMKSIVTAINNTTDVGVTAAFVKDTSSTGRVTLTSKTTGSEKKVTFDDNGSGVLNALGLDNVNPSSSNRTQTISGQEYAYFKEANVTKLDSDLEINGIPIIRGTNSIDDVLPGITLNLLKPQETTEQAVTLTTDVNTTAVENLINPFIKNYNDMINFLKQNQSSLRSDGAINSLTFRLRSISSEAVTSTESGFPKYLSEIGIKVNSDGTLSISDRDKLTQILKDNPKKVSDLFTTSDGFANKIKTATANLTGDKGLIQSRKLSLNTQIEQTSKRTKEVSERIDRQAQALRKEYESMLRVYLEAQSQYSMIGNNLLYTG